MEARIEPANVKREEYGTMVGSLAAVSEFPMTPQGLAALLQNETLVSQFTRNGAPYAALIRFQAGDR
jgi:HlyD family secretion protein